MQNGKRRYLTPSSTAVYLSASVYRREEEKKDKEFRNQEDRKKMKNPIEREIEMEEN